MARIHSIGTATPPYVYRQDYARDTMTRWIPGRRAARLIRGIYDNSGIETRHSVLPDFTPSAEPGLFRENEEGQLQEPSTGARNAVYADWAPRLAVDAARDAFAQCQTHTPSDITHLITVTCTGFTNPGTDLHLAQTLGLRSNLQRYALGFMGCYAALPALRMAQQFCAADPTATVLIVSVELCSLHLHLTDSVDSLMANAIFADGAAAVVVSGAAPAAGDPTLSLDGFHSACIPEGVDEMAWTIGDHGFDIRLSSYVPRIIAEHIDGATSEALAAWNPNSRPELWAIHPGGRAIIDRAEETLGLQASDTAASRSVLAKYGNMSSATLLFVLREMMSCTPHADGSLVAMAFGPGLTVEFARLTLEAAKTSAGQKELSTHA